MADPVTVNRGYAIPVRGADVGTWDTPVNGDFNLIDQNLGAVTNVSLSNANVTLSPAQYACGTIRLTGALTSAVSVIFPAVQAWWTIDNQTTGAFVATISMGSGQVIAVDQGSTADILIDGTNVKFRNLPGVGTYLDVCEATVPAWITACTVPPYLNCDASTFSGTTYPYLAQKLGSTTLPDLRGVTRSTLNQGTSRITTALSGIDGNTRFSNGGGQSQVLTVGQLPAITSTAAVNISVNTPAFSFFPTIPTAQWVGVNSGGTGTACAGIASGASITNLSILSAVNNISVTSVGTNTAPHPNMQPTTITGLTLIRAA